jgi:hypothetical protein
MSQITSIFFLNCSVFLLPLFIFYPLNSIGRYPPLPPGDTAKRAYFPICTYSHAYFHGLFQPSREGER